MSSEPSRIVLGVEDIDRKYEVLGKLAEGGMGAIYKARHQLLDEVRVVKTVRQQYREDPELRERFLREARVATHLHHPNIARIHDLSVGEDGTACIVMEFVHGVNLADRLRRAPALGHDEVLEITRQTLDALGYLHQRKIVHRDISPDNVMLARDPDGATQVKLIDLGIAKPLEGAGFQTKTAMFIGKVRYASPEQLGGGVSPDADSGPAGIDGRSDLYSLGIVLYELLTGEFPIRGTDEASVIAGHLFHPPRTFRETDPQGKVSEPLRQVLLRALEKRPEDRFQSAAEFIQALESARRGEMPATPAGGAAEISSSARTLVQAPAGLAPTQLGSGPPPPSLEQGTAAAATVLAGTAPAAIPAATTLETPAPTRSMRRPIAIAAAAVVAVLLLVGGILLVRARPASEPGEDPVAEPLAGVDFGSFKALVIGNSRYRQLPELGVATRDASALARVLEDDYGFTVRLLPDADRATMMEALNELANGAGPDDNLLVYYAGHGEFFGRERQGQWLPIDAAPMDATNWISTRHEVSTILAPSMARHILVIADSCYSGALAGRSRLARAGETAAATLTRDRIEELLEERSRLVLSSGGLFPVADEAAGTGHSVFTGALLEALRANTGVLSVEALYERLEPRVVMASETLETPQRPRFGPMEGILEEGSAFFFVPRRSEPEAEERASI